jgi:hypothetical protein
MHERLNRQNRFATRSFRLGFLFVMLWMGMGQWGASPSPALAETGQVFPVIVRGTVFNDRDGDGFQALNEEGIANVRLEIYDDANGNGRMDHGETKLGQVFSDVQGNYVFAPIDPGLRVLWVHPAGIGSIGGAQIPLALVSSEVEGTFIVDIGLLPHNQEVGCAVGRGKSSAVRQVLLPDRACGNNP